MPKRLFTDEEETIIVTQYLAGISSSKIAAGRTNRCTICQILARHGITRRSYKEAAKSLQVNHSAFDIITNDSAYWIGFLLSDGCIRKQTGRSAVIQLALSTTDTEHIYKFRNFIQSSHKIFISKRGYVRIAFASDHMAKSLAKYGVIPRKTGKETVIKALKYNRHFWRGIIDGDGCITHVNSPYPTLSLCGSRSVCQSFLDYVKTLATTRANVGGTGGAKCHQVAFRKNVTLTVLSNLYQLNDVALDRKAQLSSHLLGKYAYLAKQD
jgi:hypothetical protein